MIFVTTTRGSSGAIRANTDTTQGSQGISVGSSFYTGWGNTILKVSSASISPTFNETIPLSKAFNVLLRLS